MYFFKEKNRLRFYALWNYFHDKYFLYVKSNFKFFSIHFQVKCVIHSLLISKQGLAYSCIICTQAICDLLHWSARVQEDIAVTLFVLSLEWLIMGRLATVTWGDWIEMMNLANISEDAALDKNEKTTNRVTDWINKHMNW